jgi:hypothetical protein
MKFKSKYLFKGLPTKSDVVRQAFEQIKSKPTFSQYDMSNNDNIKDVILSVYDAGLKRGKNKQ